MGKPWEFDAHRAAVESPHVSLHCPKNHTYSHTQQFARINCVNSHAARRKRSIAGGWTRPPSRQRLPSALPKCECTNSRSLLTECQMSSRTMDCTVNPIIETARTKMMQPNRTARYCIGTVRRSGNGRDGAQQATDLHGCRRLERRRKRRISRTDLSDGICALLAIRLGSIIIVLSLPHDAKGS